MAHWIVVDAEHRGAGPHWLSNLLPAHGEATLQALSSAADMDRSRPRTGAAEWLAFARLAWRAWRAVWRSRGQAAGIITVFPQSAVMVGLLKRVLGQRQPVVAFSFNIGQLQGGAKLALARFALRGVNAFIVYSRAEIDVYARAFELPRERFVFLPLPRSTLERTETEELAQPFVLAMGSAGRDYPLLLHVLRELKLPATLVCSGHALQGLELPPNVTHLSGLSIAECHRLAQRARVNVVPIANATTASGQVTFLDAMALGRAVVVTRCPGSVDYLNDGEDGLLVPPGDGAALKAAIARLWSDATLREKLGQAARHRALTQHSDAHVGMLFQQVLERVAR